MGTHRKECHRAAGLRLTWACRAGRPEPLPLIGPSVGSRVSGSQPGQGELFQVMPPAPMRWEEGERVGGTWRTGSSAPAAVCTPTLTSLGCSLVNHPSTQTPVHLREAGGHRVMPSTQLSGLFLGQLLVFLEGGLDCLPSGSLSFSFSHLGF